MDPVGIVYSTEQGDFLYVSKVIDSKLWVGQGPSVFGAVTDRVICLDRETAKALINILAAEAYAD